VLAYVKQVQRIVAEVEPDSVKAKDIESNIVRCPNRAAAQKMIRLIERMRKAGDSVGGIVEGLARGVPPGWGEPVFDRLEADLAKAMLSLPASKGFDIGSGFGGIVMTGTQHNDPFRAKAGKVYTTSNRSGGIQGGISKPTPVRFSRAVPLCRRSEPIRTLSRQSSGIGEIPHASSSPRKN